MSAIQQMLLAGRGAVDGDTGFVFRTPFNVNGWTNYANAGASDNAYATHSLSSGQDTGRVGISPPGSFVPAGATILGIEVRAEAKADAVVGGEVYDLVVQMTKSQDVNTLVGANRATGSNNLGTSDTVFTWGGPTDLWGTTWTAAEWNSNGLCGPVFQWHNGDTDPRVVSVDAYSIKVYYNA